MSIDSIDAFGAKDPKDFMKELEKPKTIEKKKVKKRKLSKEEQTYYSSVCEKFYSESLTIMFVSLFLACFGLIFYLGITSGMKSKLMQIPVFFFIIGEVFLIATIFFTFMSSVFFNRTLIFVKLYDILNDKKNLALNFSKGYTNRLLYKILWGISLLNILLSVIFYSACTSIILTLCVIAVIVGMCLWIKIQMKSLEKNPVVKLSKKAFDIMSEDIINVSPPNIIKEGKSGTDEKTSISGLIATFKSETPKVRISALKSLGKLGTPDAIAILVKAVGDKVPEVRAKAITILGRIGEKSISDSLVCLLNDEASIVRAAAAEAIGNFKDESSLTTLITLLKDDSPEVRGSAAEALGNLKKKKSIKPLLEKIRDKDWFVRHKVIIALGKMKSELSIEAIERLMESSKDEHEYVALAAKHVLQKLAEDMPREDPLYEEVTEILDKSTHEEIKSEEEKPEEPEEEKPEEPKEEEKPEEPKE